ncbi:hypothetical protein AN958_09568 [Leucoagaricus sp. SymC.cos]|nr:hypothetical protein AN958_09568 [Leucoagaricus sp. SymC.cos]
MIAFTSVLALAATLAATFSQVAANPENAIHQLLARQGTSGLDPSMIPSQCRDQCSSLVTAMGQNCDLSCICGSTMANNMVSCLQCDVSIVGADTAESYYNQYANACKSAGQSVPAFTASGGSSGSSGSSSSTGNGNSSNTGSGVKQASGAPRTRLAGAGIVGALATGLFLVA